MRRAAGFQGQDTKSLEHEFLKAGNEKGVFHEKWPDLL